MRIKNNFEAQPQIKYVLALSGFNTIDPGNEPLETAQRLIKQLDEIGLEGALYITGLFENGQIEHFAGPGLFRLIHRGQKIKYFLTPNLDAVFELKALIREYGAGLTESAYEVWAKENLKIILGGLPLCQLISLPNATLSLQEMIAFEHDQWETEMSCLPEQMVQC